MENDTAFARQAIARTDASIEDLATPQRDWLATHACIHRKHAFPCPKTKTPLPIDPESPR